VVQTSASVKVPQSRFDLYKLKFNQLFPVLSQTPSQNYANIFHDFLRNTANIQNEKLDNYIASLLLSEIYMDRNLAVQKQTHTV